MYLEGMWGDCQTSDYVWLCGCAFGGIHTPQYIHTSLHTTRGHMARPSVHLSVCQAFFVFQDICLSISSSIVCQQLFNCRPVIPIINIIVDHLQYHVWLASVPLYSGYCFYCCYFCLFGLDAYRYLLRLCAVDLF